VIDSLLVANRGEIAVRILRTCGRLGIRSIAVYSDADDQALHVAQADEAYRIGPPPATASYLNQKVILDAARATEAAAIHPGYGFLSENADFAQAVVDAGLIWVGPPPQAMRALGDKARAKAIAEQHDVPLLAGYHGEDQSDAVLRRYADRIGFPILIKASAGGGGRGMRVVDSAEEFSAALEAARREARSSFGDERVLLERYVRRPRHVEVQIFGDRFGKVIHLGERDCSIQRRHQKLIEESPAPGLDGDLRARMGQAALRLARATGYANAGTVEFLLDEDGQFAFLEVNARLQVEHPVTEAVTGLDLVELQLRVAAGEPLPIDQADVRFDGHALEARVIAEDALAGFLPSSGTVERFFCPSFVRTDTWVQAGTRVSPYYDSLLGKVIAHAATRDEAIATLGRGLRDMQIDGVKHNVDLLLATIEEPAFRQGDLHTGFLDEYAVVDDLAKVPSPALAAVAALDMLSPPTASDPWRMRSVWRLGRIDQPAVFVRSGRPHTARVSAELGGEGAWVNDGHARLLVRLLQATPTGHFRLSIDGQSVSVWADGPDRRVVEWQGRGYRLQRQPPLAVDDVQHDRGAAGGAGRLTAPMPGRVVKIAVEQGQHVDQHQPLVVLEAMKMEHVVQAPHAGLVSELCVEVGQQVTSGTQLLVLGSTDTPEGVE
jgi:3-methylcrotonyl-CoA carboxylase alpha subunit